MSAMMFAAILMPEASNAELFRGGENAFHAGMVCREKKDPNDRGEADFREAARAWETIRSRGVDTALLYRNLGHAYFLAGDLPRAVLCYREATPWFVVDQSVKPEFPASKLGEKSGAILLHRSSWFMRVGAEEGKEAYEFATGRLVAQPEPRLTVAFAAWTLFMKQPGLGDAPVCLLSFKCA